MKPLAMNQPYLRLSLTDLSGNVSHPLTQTIPTGPAGMEYARVEAIDGRSPMILKAMPKTSIMVKFRLNSCL